MTLLNQKRVARVILLAAALTGAAWLWRLDYRTKVSTDVLELMPSDERTPELALVRQMAGDRVARVVLLALEFHEGAAAEARERAAEKFVGGLEASGAFAEVVRMGGTAAFEETGRHVYEKRFELLLPQWLAARKAEHAGAGGAAGGAGFAAWLAERSATELGAYLARPEAMAFQDLLPSDPLLLVPRALEPWQAFAKTQAAGDGRRVLVWALTAASPLKEEGQQPVFNAVHAAEAAARAEAAFDFRWTGIARFATASRSRIEAEMSLLNTLSLAVVLLIGFASVRKPLKALHLAPVLVFALLGAWVATTAVFPRVHVLVFVVGSLLGGVAVDYGFYLFLQPPRYEGETATGKVRRLMRPLLASALTTVIGFSLLLFSDLPMIRQLGVFVSAGLLCALGAAALWFLQSGESCWGTRALASARLPVAVRGRWRPVLLAAVTAAAVFGMTRLTWRDDIRELDIPAPELRANDGAVRALFGESDDQTIYLTRGEDVAEARRKLGAFHAWHRSAFPGSVTASLGALLPTQEELTAAGPAMAELKDFAAKLKEALAAQGFDAEAFAPFFAAWDAVAARAAWPAQDELVRGLAGAVRGPLALSMETGGGASWFATVTEHGPGEAPPRELSTVSSEQLESLNELFGRYRESALRLSSIGLGLVGLSVFVLYGLRQGLAIFALPAGSCLVAFGLLGLAGQTLNLFHLLGAFLGVCLSHNYAIFSAENRAAGDVPPPSIRLSALTTSASFGVLALSRIPVIAALGTMVAVIVLVALLAVELELLGVAVGRRGEK